MTAEADSGGHTDNRPALTLLPTFLAVRDEAARRYGYQIPLRVGLGGGIATPEATAAAFAMGAAYVLTGSINQACVEADTSEIVRDMLIKTQQADVIMAPAADMFELGAKVQVLKRGTMFAMRATKLYDLYRGYDAFDQIPDKEKGFIESELLKLSFEQAWEQTKQFFATRDPSQIARALNEPKHKMALVFRSYLGQASLWAKKGDRTRQIDYQIWCGPAMGAFNSWVKGSFLEKTENRRTDLVALNLLYGASVLVRHHWLRCQGISLPADTTSLRPMTKEEIDKKLD
jgi:PfaD family protein